MGSTLGGEAGPSQRRALSSAQRSLCRSECSEYGLPQAGQFDELMCVLSLRPNRAGDLSDCLKVDTSPSTDARHTDAVTRTGAPATFEGTGGVSGD